MVRFFSSSWALPWQSLVCGAALGAPWLLGFAPWGWWWLPFLQLLALLHMLGRAATARAAFALGWGFAWAAFAVGVSWLYISLHTYGGLPAPLAVLAVLAFTAYLGLYAGLACFAACWLKLALTRGGGLPAHSFQRFEGVWGLAFAALWTLAEWLRGIVFTGFAWLNLGDTLVDSPFAGILAWVGNHGAAAWVLAFAIALFLLLRALKPMLPGFAKACLGPALMCVLLGVGGLGVLHVPIHTRAQAVLPVAGVQTNLDQSLKFDEEKIVGNVQQALHLGRTAKALLPTGGLLLFPETVNPVLWGQSPAPWREAFRNLAGNGHAVALGAALQDHGQFYNSYLLLRGHESPSQLQTPAERHDKRHLVPFGEFIPPGFAWFVAMMNIPLGSFAAGQGPVQPWAWSGQHLAVTICYEDIFSDELAALLASASAEPTVLINASNLAWFGQTWALDQHAQMGRTRSAEHHKPGLRITNTGLSGVVGADGQWQQRIPPWVGKVWVGQVQGRLGKTPFARWGVKAWAVVWFVLLLPALGVLLWRQTGVQSRF